MSSPISMAIENAVSKIVIDFQSDANRFWNERDIHWSLFHYLKQEPECNEKYPTQILRAELPTLKVFEGVKPARGHYDLVVLDSDSYLRRDVQEMKAQASWQEFLESIQIAAAIEIKLWLNRMKRENMEERINWDIRKLTDKPNNIENAYFLNFVQLDFKRPHVETFYNELREYLAARKCLGLNILCAPSDNLFQPDHKDDWL